jgi:hypothetical protein
MFGRKKKMAKKKKIIQKMHYKNFSSEAAKEESSSTSTVEKEPTTKKREYIDPIEMLKKLENNGDDTSSLSNLSPDNVDDKEVQAYQSLAVQETTAQESLELPAKMDDDLKSYITSNNSSDIDLMKAMLTQNLRMQFKLTEDINNLSEIIAVLATERLNSTPPSESKPNLNKNVPSDSVERVVFK